MPQKSLVYLKEKKTIGILGGMGPIASANLYYKIIKTAQEKYSAVQDYDFPPMLIYNLPLLGFDETGIVEPELVKKQLMNGVEKLAHVGSDFIIIACNTVHCFIQEMRQAVTVPIISIVEETVKQVKVDGYNLVGFLSSASTRTIGIYQNALKQADIEFLSIMDAQQEIINRIILKVMSGKQSKEDTLILKKIIINLRALGAQSIILGCTELPLAINQGDIGIKLFDSVEIIVESALKKAFMD